MGKPQELPEVQVSELRDVNSLLELDYETTDATRHYYWCRETPLRVGKLKMRGYRIELKSGGVKTLAGYTDDSAGDIIRVDDVILMSCDLKEWRKRKRGQTKFSEARLSAPAKQFKRNARRRRVKIIRDEEGDE